eukprot:TRINITY_DN648_c0_g1_i3.p1 TRINITY_DN648_c0_g1~~TRINITY_DN648_c0_g1_i3.p1  ORF type:complete len:768 (-),score=186.46 TRINITY_DN648_c0_g1_i3:65-2368(-)
MFWRLGNLPQDSLDALLAKDDFTLDEVLDEADILQECKGHNKKLLAYLTKEEVLTALLDYVTQEPDDDADQKHKFKFPHVCSELLSTDVQVLANAVVETRHLNHLFSLLERPETLPIALAPYFQKIFDNLLKRCPNELMAYLKGREDSVALMLRHIDSYPIYEVIVMLVTNQESLDADDLVEWLHERGLISKLLEGLAPPCSADTKANCAEALCAVVRQSGTEGLFATQLQSEGTLVLLLTHALDKSEESFFPCMSVLTTLFEIYGNESASTDGGTTPPFVNTVVEHLAPILSTLNQAPGYTITNTAGVLSPPLGRRRLQVIEFIAALSGANYPTIHQAFVKLDIMKKCLDLFFELKWCNMLHTIVTGMLKQILTSESKELIAKVVKDYDLPSRIVACTKHDAMSGHADKVGYMGHLVSISNYIVQSGQLNEDILGEFLSGNSDWQEYENTTLPLINKKQDTPLGDGHGTTKDLAALNNSSDDEPFDSELFHLESGGDNGDGNTTNLQLILGGQFPEDFNNPNRESGLGLFEDDTPNMFDDTQRAGTQRDDKDISRASSDINMTGVWSDSDDEGSDEEVQVWPEHQISENTSDSPGTGTTGGDGGDNGAGWANFDQATSNSTQGTSAPAADGGWANFDNNNNNNNNNNSDSQDNDGGWAHFDNPQQGDSNAPAADGGWANFDGNTAGSNTSGSAMDIDQGNTTTTTTAATATATTATATATTTTATATAASGDGKDKKEEGDKGTTEATKYDDFQYWKTPVMSIDDL